MPTDKQNYETARRNLATSANSLAIWLDAGAQVARLDGKPEMSERWTALHRRATAIRDEARALLTEMQSQK